MSEELEAEEFPEDFVKFPTRTIEKIFRLVWKESSTRISGDALKASAELLRLFVKGDECSRNGFSYFECAI